MKILHVTPAFWPATYWGGPIYSLFGLCKTLAENGEEVRVLTTNTNGKGNLQDIPAGKEISIEGSISIRYCRRLIRNSVSGGLLMHLAHSVAWADVVHLTGVYSFTTFPTLAMCKLLDKPVVWSPRGALQRWTGSRRRMAKAIWEWACRTVAPASLTFLVTSEQEAMATRERFPEHEIEFIPHGVVISETTRSIEEREIIRFLYLGRLDPVKGIERLLEACQLFSRSYGHSWSLTIAGSGDAGYAEALRRYVNKLGLDRHVLMVGEVAEDRKKQLFAHADIAVIPSYIENFGIVVAEALGHGIPVIASKGTPWQRIEEMGCGLWVDNDPESLANAMERMSHMPLQAMGQRGREWMRQEYSWGNVAQKVQALYARPYARRVSE